MSSNADQSSLFEPLSITKFDHTDAIRIEGREDLFTLRSFLGGDDDEASLLDSFNAEESFFDLPEDVIADLETIPEIDECPAFSEQATSPRPMSLLTHSVERLNISHDSSTTFETALDTFSDSTSTLVATSRTFSDSSSSSSSSPPGGFHISDSFAECMRKSSESRQQLNVWQEQVRGNGSLSVSTNNTTSTTSTERKRSRSTVEESTTTMSAAASISTPSTALPSTTATTDVSSLEAATPPFPKRQARPETVMCTAQFLCGSRPTLTAALEQSRQALKEYMMRARCA